jgi:hypothetical protein
MSRLSLALLLVTYLVLGVAYAVYTPTWQVPDEPAHFNYVRTLVEERQLPVLQPGCYPHEYLETLKARRFPDDMSVDPLCYEAHQPPLYYVLAAPVFALSQGLPLAQQVIALRLFSVLLGAVLLGIAWRVVQLVFPVELPLAVASVGFVAFLPMHLTMVAAVNNDTLAEVVMAAVLWLGLSRLHGRFSNGWYAVFGGILLALALLTKTTIYLPAFAVLVGGELGQWWGDWRIELRRSAATLLQLLAVGLALSAWWFLRNALTYDWTDPFGWKRHDAVAVGQPRTLEWVVELGAVRVARAFAVTTFKSFWGIFGWMGVPMDQRTYAVLFMVSAVAGLGLLLFAWRVWRSSGALTARQCLALGLLALPPLLALAGHLWYNLSFVQHQGRYLFPGLVPLALFFTLGLREVLASEHEGVLLGLWTAGLAGLAAYSLFRFIIPNLG